MNVNRSFVSRKRLLIAATIFLALCCFVYITRGFYFLVIRDHFGGDLVARWREQRYIYQGLYPYDIQEGSPFIDPAIGPIKSGFYPPWAFLSGFLLFPPVPLPVLRWYHAVLNLVALGSFRLSSWSTLWGA